MKTQHKDVRPTFSKFLSTPSVTRFAILMAVSGLLLITACGASRSASAEKAEPAAVDPYANFFVDFMHTDKLSVALERAKAEDKMVFIDFYTSWCLPCKLMDEDVFTDKEFGDYMNQHFISVKIDAEHGNGPNLAALYGVKSYPTLLFVDLNGRVKSRKEGAAYQTELRRMGNEARVAGL
ncbi:MAG: thioredoxin family protein [Saprospiraceae bacterium]